MEKLKAQKKKNEKNDKAFRNNGGNFSWGSGHTITSRILGQAKGAGRSPGPSIFNIFIGSALLFRCSEGNLVYGLYGG